MSNRQKNSETGPSWFTSSLSLRQASLPGDKNNAISLKPPMHFLSTGRIKKSSLEGVVIIRSASEDFRYRRNLYRTGAHSDGEGITSLRQSSYIEVEVGSGGGGGFHGATTFTGGNGSERIKIGAYYEEMLKSNPTNALLLRNYDKFLYEVEKEIY